MTMGKKIREYAKQMEQVRVEEIIAVGAPGSWQGRKKVRMGREGGKVRKAFLGWMSWNRKIPMLEFT